jgi:Cof subfamily protein (haloacid dehalogenase superfamily)
MNPVSLGPDPRGDSLRNPADPARIQAILLDLDGTLLTSEKTISDTTREVLIALKAEGMNLIIATGRMFDTASGYTQSLSIDRPYVLANGAVIAEPKKGTPLIEHLLDWAVCRELVLLARREGLHVQMFVGNTLYYEVDEPRERAADPFAFAAGRQVDFLEISFPAVTKVLLVGDEEASLRVLKEVHALHPGSLYSVKSWERYYEVMNVKANKCNGMTELSRMLSIPVSAFMAFGDADNDIEMIRNAGVGVAMGNGSPGLKEAADYVAGGNDEDGIGFFLKEYFSLQFPRL